MVARRIKEGGRVNDEIPPRGIQVPIGGEGNEVPVVPPNMTNDEIREALLALAQFIATHVNRCVEPRVSSMENTMKSRLRYFLRINPPMFLVLRWERIPKSF